MDGDPHPHVVTWPPGEQATPFIPYCASAGKLLRENERLRDEKWRLERAIESALNQVAYAGGALDAIEKLEGFTRVKGE